MIRKNTERNEKIKYRAWALILLLSLLASLFSCSAEDPDYKEGITITDDIKPHSEATSKRAGEVIFDLLSELYITNGLPSISTATQNELRDMSEDIRKLSVEKPISEKQYKALLDVLDDRRDLAVRTLSAAFGGADGGVSIPEMKELYLAIAEHTGADYVGALLYRLTLYSYEYNYGKAIARYEKYGYPHLLAEAEKYNMRRSLLVSGVGEENFAIAARLSFMLAETFFGGGFEGEKIASFSKDEILLFLKQVKFSSLSVTSDGWRLLISYFIPSRSASDDSALNSIIYKADANGDLDELAESFADVIGLLAFIQDNLDGADVEAMRNGRPLDLLSAAFSKFGDAEWELVESISKIEFESAEYEAVCEAFYGEEFRKYSESIEAVSLDELRGSVGGDAFSQKLEGYVAGISPAFSYWIGK